MIADYNRMELTLAILCGVGALFVYAITFVFFCFIFALFSGLLPELNHKFSVLGAECFGITALILISISGNSTWRSSGKFESHHASDLNQRLEEVSVGAFVVNRYTARVTGPAYLLSQLFLGGPLLALRGLVHLRNRIPSEPGLEENLQRVLQAVTQANQWQSLNDYPADRREILLLAKMGLIDFSAAKGVPRLRSR